MVSGLEKYVFLQIFPSTNSLITEQHDPFLVYQPIRCHGLQGALEGRRPKRVGRFVFVAVRN